MQRRQFLKAGALVSATAPALAAPAIAQSSPEIKWRLTSSFPKSLDTIFGSAKIFARNVAEATDNKFQIQIFAAGELVPGLQALEAISSGTVECAQTPIYYYMSKDPTLGIGTGLPFGLNQRHQQAWWSFGGGGEIVNEALKPFEAYAIPIGNTGTQMGGWFRNEINSIDDLKGLRFRIGGMGGAILARLAVAPQQIAPGDIYSALEHGTIDAAEFAGPYDDERLGLSKIVKYYYYPGWWEANAMMHLVINLEQWNALPKAYQAIVFGASDAASTWMTSKYDAVNAPALKRLIAAGTILKPFPQAVLEACYKAAKEYFAEISGKNALFKKALDSINAFRAEQLPLWQVADYSFDSFMIAMRNRG
jgi:TRAP-type mannitol/chloroaromatic compound transport system substrate-binding protein